MTNWLFARPDPLDPNWFFEVIFTDGTAMLFYADTKPLAHDHAETVARDLRKAIVKITRLKHKKDITPDEAARAGSIYPRH